MFVHFLFFTLPIELFNFNKIMKYRVKTYVVVPVLFFLALLSFKVQASDFEDTKEKVRAKTSELVDEYDRSKRLFGRLKSCQDIANEVVDMFNSRAFSSIRYPGLNKIGYDTAYDHCKSKRYLKNIRDLGLNA